MLFQRLANAKLVIRPFEPADADEQISAGEKVALILVSNPETGARERRIVKL